ncbi:hypothetical protein N7466_009339 [Penicillium verhagenii]|uniref:uncharacterized protein n=1 Tax=Penicillium verhagenii TaxID=1562060 RepID=UPI002544F199|nr:uncharacterized protein N7466_009339 [Penicillium verhagenii]KAJ5921013.1 hypothetical protein N7466_009339 [Penicillium verhagenii]
MATTENEKKRKVSPVGEEKRPAKKSRTYVLEVFLKMEDLPHNIRSKKVSQCFIEFIDKAHDADLESDEDDIRPNHCFMRLIFKNQQTKNAKGSTPINSRGIIINLKYNHPGFKRCSLGDLDIRTFTYAGPHRNAVKVMEVPVNPNNQGKTVRDFLRVIEDKKMLLAGFVTEDEDVVGCKDFMCQYTNNLINAGVLDVQEEAKQATFETWNYNYGPAMDENRPQKVGYAAFNTAYHDTYQEIEHIVYRGNRIALDSAQVNELICTATNTTAYLTQASTETARGSDKSKSGEDESDSSGNEAQAAESRSSRESTPANA